MGVMHGKGLKEEMKMALGWSVLMNRLRRYGNLKGFSSFKLPMLSVQEHHHGYSGKRIEAFPL